MKQSLVAGAVLAAAAVAHAGPTPVDLAGELRAIAAKFPPARAPVPAAVPSAGCKAPTAAEKADVKKRALAWIDQQHPDETDGGASLADLGLVVRIGCKDAAGAIVLDVSQDRELKKKKQDAVNGTRRNYLLKVSAAIEVLAEDVSTPSMDWMEWADEGRIALLAELDLDGDGALDIVYSDHEHEGGATRTFDQLHVRFATGKIADSANIEELAEVRIVANHLVVAAATRSDALVYACVGADLHVAPCAASKALQAAADKRAIIDRFAQAAPGDLPDRAQLEADLATLGTRAARRAALVAAAPPTDPAVRVQREVNAFLLKAGLIEPAPELFSQRHADAQAYIDGLAAKLGDAPCTQTPLSAADTAAATAWVKKQDEKASEVVIAPAACGPYVWVGWWPPNNTDNKRRQALLGRDGTRILGFTYEPEMPGDTGLSDQERWFTHDGALVGVVIASGNLWVVAGGKVAATTKGDSLGFYAADDRFSESSADIFIDGGTLWHATPAGRERLDMALVRDHEARRAAIALLMQPPTRDPRYAAALALLGADKALIAEAKKLPN